MPLEAGGSDGRPAGGGSETHEELTRERQEAIRTPQDVIFDALVTVSGSPPQKSRRLSVSYSNDVYVVTTRAGAECIVRVHAHGPRGYFDRERWALDRCREAGVPTPTMLDVLEDERDGVLWIVAVQTMLPGEPLEDVMEVDTVVPTDVASAVEEAGHYLKLIHSIPTIGFGLIDASGVAAGDSWEVFTQRFDPDVLADLASTVAIDPALVVNAVDRLRTGARTFEASVPGLLHGDFAPKHVLVRGPRATGVIDFEFARSGYPAADLAFWRYAHPRSYERLCLGYGASVDNTSILLHSLDISLSYVEYHGARNELRGEFRDLVATRLEEDLRDL